MNQTFVIMVGMAAMMLVTFIFGIRASLYAKVVPSLALILSGRKVRLPDGRVVGFRYVKGGGTFDLPVG